MKGDGILIILSMDVSSMTTDSTVKRFASSAINTSNTIRTQTGAAER